MGITMDTWYPCQVSYPLYHIIGIFSKYVVVIQSTPNLTYNIYTIVNNEFPFHKSFILDFGADTHVCNNIDRVIGSI